MYLASGDAAPAHQDAPQLVTLLCLPSGAHRSSVPHFIQTPRAQREGRGGRARNPGCIY